MEMLLGLVLLALPIGMLVRYKIKQQTRQFTMTIVLYVLVIVFIGIGIDSSDMEYEHTIATQQDQLGFIENSVGDYVDCWVDAETREVENQCFSTFSTKISTYVDMYLE